MKNITEVGGVLGAPGTKLIKKNHRTKKDLSGWILAMRFADQDFPYTLDKGSLVDVYERSDGKVFVSKTDTMRNFGFNLFQSSKTEFVSNLLDKKTGEEIKEDINRGKLMKKSELRSLIKEEIKNILSESKTHIDGIIEVEDSKGNKNVITIETNELPGFGRSDRPNYEIDGEPVSINKIRSVLKTAIRGRRKFKSPYFFFDGPKKHAEVLPLLKKYFKV